jgi:hypothetical protein
LFLVLGSFSCSLRSYGKGAEGIPLGNFEGSGYNKILNRQIPIKIEATTTTKDSKKDKPGQIMLCIDETIASACFQLSTGERKNLLGLASKFSDWAKKATERKDSFEKEVGKLTLKGAIFIMNKEPYFDFERYTITATFFSRKAGDYQFVLQFPKIKSSNNKYISHSPSELYLDPKQLESLVGSLGQDELKAKINTFYEEQKKLETAYK